MVWVITNEQPRFKELTPGDIFSFNSGKVEELDLQGWWLRVQDPEAADPPANPPDPWNAVRVTDGTPRRFKSDDPVEPCFSARLMT